MFIITLMKSLILRRGEKNPWFMPPLLPFPVLICENKIPVNSRSIKSKQLWGQAFTCTALLEGPQCMHGYAAPLGSSSPAEESEHKLANWPWQQTHFISLCAFIFPVRSKSQSQSRAPSQLSLLSQNAPNLLNTCQLFFFVSLSLSPFFLPLLSQWRPFQPWTETHLQCSPSVLFTGKQEKGGESEDGRGRNKTVAGTF